MLPLNAALVASLASLSSIAARSSATRARAVGSAEAVYLRETCAVGVDGVRGGDDDRSGLSPERGVRGRDASEAAASTGASGGTAEEPTGCAKEAGAEGREASPGEATVAAAEERGSGFGRDSTGKRTNGCGVEETRTAQGEEGATHSTEAAAADDETRTAGLAASGGVTSGLAASRGATSGVAVSGGAEAAFTSVTFSIGFAAATRVECSALTVAWACLSAWAALVGFDVPTPLQVWRSREPSPDVRSARAKDGDFFGEPTTAFAPPRRAAMEDESFGGARARGAGELVKAMVNDTPDERDASSGPRPDASELATASSSAGTETAEAGAETSSAGTETDAGLPPDARAAPRGAATLPFGEERDAEREARGRMTTESEPESTAATGASEETPVKLGEAERSSWYTSRGSSRFS